MSAEATDTLGSALLVRARNAIAAEFGQAPQAEVAHDRLTAPGATFVTLTQDGELRGCIGTLAAWRRLDLDVRENAVAAAFRDPRFSPLRRDELECTRVEVSLLAAAVPLHFSDEVDVLRQLRPGRDGVILEYGHHRSTFLPQVWESLPEPREFLAQLKRKAGLPPNFWDRDVHLSCYKVDKWKE
jgi:AmmeMemoRadiSam system protein A